MNEPLWLPLQVVIDLQSEQLARFGGPDGTRDQGSLESALSRPINRWYYGEEDLAKLAASYAFGLVRNHPFVDGNKRIGFQAMMTFLRLNDVAFAPKPAEATVIILSLAEGEISEVSLARWIRNNWPSA